MSMEFAQQNWALLSACVVGAGVLLFVLWRSWQDSAKGRLRAELKRLGKRRKAVRKQQEAVRKAERRLNRLQPHASSIKPLRLEEAKESLDDARMLLKIAGDHVLAAKARVRTIIVKEFPPNRHEALRQRYLDE